VNRPDQVWVANITYVRLRNEFVYFSMLMDVFTRSIRGWRVGHILSATHPRTQRAAAASGTRSAPPEAKAIGTLKT
jgi:putative transposase